MCGQKINSHVCGKQPTNNITEIPCGETRISQKKIHRAEDIIMLKLHVIVYYYIFLNLKALSHFRTIRRIRLITMAINNHLERCDWKREGPKR